MLNMFLDRYYPNDYAEDVFSIDYQLLYNRGFRGLIFDIDNTLVPHGAPIEKKIIDLFNRLRAIGFKMLLLSNNGRERVESFNSQLHAEYIHDAGKPSPECFVKAAQLLSLQKKQLIMIGDTVFTDIVGASKAGIASILVKYIGYYSKGKKGLKRRLEKYILKLNFIFKKRSLLK